MHSPTDSPLPIAKRTQRSTEARQICCISINFPPSSIASVHRVRHLAKYLPEHGWDPTVICVDERDLPEALDWRLLKLVSDNVSVCKVRALPFKLLRPLGVTDPGLRALLALRAEMARLAQEIRFDAIFITGWPFYQMLLGGRMKALFGAPLVLDFQDPWVSVWSSTQPKLSKAGVTHQLSTALEPIAIRQADFITSVSDMQNADMAARYPWLDPTRMAGIPIGGDPDDFAALRALHSSEIENRLEPGFIHLSYVGTFLPRADGPMRMLFRAFAQLRRSKPNLAARIRLNFIGTSNQSNDVPAYSALPLAEAEGVADCVREVPQRLPYLDAISVLLHSDGVLLIGSDEPHYTASKIYPGLMSGRPFLSLFHPASSAHAILEAAGGGIALTYREPHEELEEALVLAIERIVCDPASLGVADPAAYAPYHARAVSRRFAGIFDDLTRRIRTRSSRTANE